MLPYTVDLTNITGSFRRLLAEGKTTNQALAELRAAGAGFVSCMVAVRTFRQCDFVEAKKVVIDSPAFIDQKEFHDRLFDETFESADELPRPDGETPGEERPPT